MELSPEQIFIVGLVASLLGTALRLVAAKFGVEIEKGWMTVIVAGVALLLAVLFNLPQLPVYTDPLSYLGAWSALIASYLGAATAIYNIILDKVLDKLSLNIERFGLG